MTIQTFESLTLARAVPDPKTIVSYDGVHVVYSDTDLNTPPQNPAEMVSVGTVVAAPVAPAA